MLLLIVFVSLFNLICSAHSIRYQNVAQFKSSSQSSISGALNPASLAIDDSIQTCSRTATEKNESWVLDLEQNYIISALLINTGSSYFGPHFEIYIGKDELELLCNYGPQSDIRREHNLTCLNGPIEGRFLIIRNTFSGGVRLCDVQVLVCIDGYFGSACIFDCHCHMEALCSKNKGICPGSCAAGWTGVNCQNECDRGVFGIDCNNTCHCENNAPCDIYLGHCPNGCDQGWLGQTCQTETPMLIDQPLLVNSHTTGISIKWLSWNQFVDSILTLLYQVEFKLNDFHGGNTTWIEGPIVVDGNDKWEQATIVSLEKNSFYEFRILPIIRMNDQTEVKGGVGLKSPVFRTKCTAPETPNITMLSLYIDEKGKPGLIVEWKSLTREESNCDSIQYYKILYTCSTEASPKVDYALQSVWAKNISNLKYDEVYLVALVAVNNQDLESTSFRQQIITYKPPTAALNDHSSTSISFGIILGIFACCVLIAFILISVFILRRYRVNCKNVSVNNMKNNIYISRKESNLRMDVTSPFLTPSLAAPTIYHRLSKPPQFDNAEELVTDSSKRLPIKILDLEEYIVAGKANDCELFKAEYKEIPNVNLEATQINGNRSENRLKNRFLNVLPYDHARVILNTIEGFDDSDYINASFIDGYNNCRAYIAAQGCNKWTIQDMWRMIWQVNCLRIVMVTNLIEKGKNKCEQYWPDLENVDKVYGEIIVRLIDIEKTTDFTVRTFLLLANNEVRTVRQFHYVTWPDHGVPTRPGPIIELRRKVKMIPDDHVIVVHCSAGVGRTGAYIALDYLLEQAEAEGQVDIYTCVSSMRQHRINMVQTLDQYLFIYGALMEALKIGCTVLPCNTFTENYNYLCDSKDGNGMNLLERQYETLNSVSYKRKEEDYSLVDHQANQGKNRFPTILPADKHRPYLNTNVQGTNSYINAIFVDGYRHRNAYLLTQMPLPHTVIDLWRLVFEHKCNSVVMLNQWDYNDESYGQYWPEENEECECGPFIIEANGTDTTHPNITIRHLQLTLTVEGAVMLHVRQDENIRSVTLLQLTNWETNSPCPSSFTSIITLLNLTEKSQCLIGNSPIIIHCRDGSLQSGLFCVLTYIWERLKDDQEIDIFYAVKHLRHYRPSIITNYIQYKFLYEIVLEYLKEFSTYANFK